MIHFLAPTPVFFGNLKQHPKFPRPNFSLWKPRPDDVRLNIRCHWSSQARLCHQLPAAAPSQGVQGVMCGPGRCQDHQPQMMGVLLLHRKCPQHLDPTQSRPGKVFPKGRGSSHSISKLSQNTLLCVQKKWAGSSSKKMDPVHLPLSARHHLPTATFKKMSSFIFRHPTLAPFRRSCLIPIPSLSLCVRFFL